jgi:hypothetical protein
LDDIVRVENLHDFVTAFIYVDHAKYGLDVPEGLVYDKIKPVFEDMVQTKKLYMWHDRHNSPSTIKYSWDFVHDVLKPKQREE